MLKVYWGRVTDDGHTYYGDLVISRGGDIARWDHRAGDIRNLLFIHRLMAVPEDLLEGIKVIIIGQGHFRFLQAGSKLKRSLKARGILLKQARSPKAAAEFARINDKSACMFLLHTKC